MQLITQPDDGIEPILAAIEKARKSIDIVVFRLDIKDVVNALAAAVARGVAVRALIAHTNKGGERALRKLEARLLDAGATVSRTADDLVRYHGKMMIVDQRLLQVNGFNFTWIDVERSRSFGVATTSAPLVKAALELFAADLDRQPCPSCHPRLVVSPDNARARLGDFIRKARKQLLIYDPEVSDPRMVRAIAERVKAGVDVRILGDARAETNARVEEYPGKRLHIRAMIRDRRAAFLGSQSLRSLELDRRREIGLLVTERPVVTRMAEVFEADWARTDAAPAGEPNDPADTHAPKDLVEAV